MVASLPYSGPCSEPPMLLAVIERHDNNHHQPLEHQHQQHHYDKMIHEDDTAEQVLAVIVVPSTVKVSASSSIPTNQEEEQVLSPQPSSPRKTTTTSTTTRRRQVSFNTNADGKLKLKVYRYVCTTEQRRAMYSDHTDVERIQDACRRLVMIYRNRSDYMDSLDMLYSPPPSEQQDQQQQHNTTTSAASVAAEESALRLVSRCSSRGLERQIYKNIKTMRRSTIARMLALQASHDGNGDDNDDDDLEQKLAALSIQTSARDKLFALKLALGDDKEAKRVYNESSFSSAAARNNNMYNNSNSSNNSNMWLVDARGSDHSLSSMASTISNTSSPRTSSKSK